MAKAEPGRDPEMVERTQRLNLLFAVSSLALLLVLSIMVWADYARGWKSYQKAFGALELRQTREQLQQARGKLAPDARAALRAELARGEQEVAARRAELRQAQREIEAAHAAWYAVDQDWRFTKALIDVARYEYEEAVLHGGPKQRKQARLEALEQRWQRLRVDLEQAQAREAAARARVAEIEKTRLGAEARQKELLADLTRLEDKLRRIEPGVVSFVRNLPVLDMANPSLKVNQIMPANLFDDVIFSPTPKVDRCTTCHLGIDRKGYETAAQPFTTHPDMDLYLRGPHPIEKVGCTVCHQGRGRATGFVNAAHTPSSKEQEKAWGRYSGGDEYHGLHYWDLPMLARGHTESQCLKCHQGQVEVPRAEKLNTGVLLIERYGCFGCHKIKGWEGMRKVGPDLSKLASKTSEDWIFRWIKEPRAFRPTRMPQVWDVRTPDQETAERKRRNDTEANAVVAYLMAKSSRESYPEPPRGDLESGRRLFESVGCLGCHRVGDDNRGIEGPLHASFRSHGPNLDGSGSKLDAGWLYAWIRDPKAYWHDTRMPNLRLTEREAADVTAYLMSLRQDDFMGRQRPPLDAKLRDEVLLREYLETQYTLADAKAKLDALDDHARTLLLGEKTIARYGCFGCHAIPGLEKASPIGVELTEEGSKLVERLDFGYVHEIPHTLPGWLRQKLLEPRIFDRDKPTKKPDELLRMPKFHLSPEEADAIVTAVLSLTKEQVPLAAQRQLSADQRYVEQGRRLVRAYNCQGCHQIGAKGGAIRAVIEQRLEAAGGDPLQAHALAPPQLYNEKAQLGEGARVHTAWLHGFLKDPSHRIRPWLEVRMPSFELEEEQVNALTRYFAAQDKVPYPFEPTPTLDPALVASGRTLFERWQCVRCHVVAGRLPQGQEPANMAPDLAEVPRRLRAEWLTAWLADPGRILPGTRMPSNFPANPEENAYPEILGGDPKRQIEAVRAYLLTLGPGGGTAAAR